MRIMTRSLAYLRVWIDCSGCGSYPKLMREVILPLEELDPVFVKTCAVCDRCHRLAILCLERTATRLH
jgi:hypothetical protein